MKHDESGSRNPQHAREEHDQPDRPLPRRRRIDRLWEAIEKSSAATRSNGNDRLSAAAMASRWIPSTGRVATHTRNAAVNRLAAYPNWTVRLSGLATAMTMPTT